MTSLDPVKETGSSLACLQVETADVGRVTRVRVRILNHQDSESFFIWFLYVGNSVKQDNDILMDVHKDDGSITSWRIG